MSVYDSKDLMSFNRAAREYSLPVTMFQIAVSEGALRVIEHDGMKLLLRPDVEQFVKRTIKCGAGNKVITPLNP